MTTTCQRRPSLACPLPDVLQLDCHLPLSHAVSARVHADHESASAYALTGIPSLPLLLPDDDDDAPMPSLTVTLSLTTALTQRRQHKNTTRARCNDSSLPSHPMCIPALFPNSKSLRFTQKTVNQHCVSDNILRPEDTPYPPPVFSKYI